MVTNACLPLFRLPAVTKVAPDLPADGVEQLGPVDVLHDGVVAAHHAERVPQPGFRVPAHGGVTAVDVDLEGGGVFGAVRVDADRLGDVGVDGVLGDLPVEPGQLHGVHRVDGARGDDSQHVPGGLPGGEHRAGAVREDFESVHVGPPGLTSGRLLAAPSVVESSTRRAIPEGFRALRWAFDADPVRLVVVVWQHVSGW
jgi:hypothetical protein